MNNSAKVLGQLFVKNEDIEAVGALIRAFEGYVQVKETNTTADNNNYTPLNVVVSKYGDKDIFKLLADFTALEEPDVKTRSAEYDFAALHVATHYANTEKIKYLLSKGADVNAKFKNPEHTHLKHAALTNCGDSHFETIELLLKNGADVNDGDPLALVLDNPKMFELFLKYNVKPTRTDLLRAIHTGNVEVVRLLINNGLNDKSLYSDDESVLPSAVGSGNVEIVKLLIDHGFKYNSKLLHEVARCNKGLSHYKVAEMLLNMGLDVNAQDYENLETPIHILAWKCESLEFMELFLDHKPDLTSQNWHGGTPLVKAIRRENLEFVKLLIDRGSDVNYFSHSGGETPLHSAINFDKDLKIIKCLLNNGADPHAIDQEGNTPLTSFLSHFKCEAVPDRTLMFFMKYSDVNVNNGYGINVMEFSCSCRGEICKCKVIILKHLAKLQALDVPLDSSIIKSIQNEKELSDYFDKCAKELSLTKETKLRNSWITFFNLLIDNKRKLKNYAGNEDLVEDYKKSDWLKIFPIYGAEMQENTKKGIERRELFDDSAVILSDILPIFSPTHLVIKDVLDCVTKKELKKFSEKGAQFII